VKLTDRQVRNLKPGPKDQIISDGDRLYLRVYSTGGKTWLLRAEVNGRTRWTTLGRYPEMTLAQARAVAGGYAEAGIAMTVEKAATIFHKEVLTKQYRRPDIPWGRITLDVIPVIGHKRVSDLTRDDVFAALNRPLSRDSPVSANRLLADLQHMCTYFVDRGWLGANPTLGVTRRSVGGRERSRDRNLDWAELGQFIGILMGDRFDLSTRLALGLVLTTGQRPSEVLDITAGAIFGRWWAISDNKSSRPHKVYLSNQSAALLRVAFQQFGPRPFTSDHRALSRAAKRIGMGFTPHDLRRTMATRLSDLGVMPHVTEKMLNHRMEGVMAVYNRAEFLPERMAAWKLWGSALQRIKKAQRPGEKPRGPMGIHTPDVLQELLGEARDIP